jgi:myo-inositol 2-dehydrogenase/D-chiro-inositol 1-dehydrogenase
MSDLKVAVVGAGIMGADHIRRLTNSIVGAEVSWVVEPDKARVRDAVASAPNARSATNFEEALGEGDIDAVLIATPGDFHESVLIPALEAGLPILCEKPLTRDPEAALRVLSAEQAGGKKLIQVGFMRRFDKEYMQLRELIISGTAGALLGLRCQHRNPNVPDGYSNDMLINDSVVHEIDVVRYLTGSPIAAIEVKYFQRNSLAPDRLKEPILVLLETGSGILADVEMNVSVQFGYQVKTEALFEKGIAEIGRTSGMTTWTNGRYGGEEYISYTSRFADAYDHQVQRWVTATKRGEIDGPNAWDGYLAAAACKAGIAAMHSGKRVAVDYVEIPAFYT